MPGVNGHSLMASMSDIQAIVTGRDRSNHAYYFLSGYFMLAVATHLAAKKIPSFIRPLRVRCMDWQHRTLVRLPSIIVGLHLTQNLLKPHDMDSVLYLQFFALLCIDYLLQSVGFV